METHAIRHAVPPGFRFRNHRHEGPHLCAVLSGGFVERNGSSWVDVGPGTVRVSGGARHDIDFSTAGAECLLVHPTGADLPALDRPLFLAGDPWLQRLMGRIARADRSPEPDAALELEDETTELLAQVLRRASGRSGGPPPWLARVHERIHDAPHPLSVGSLAEDVGVHRVHLARAFREHYGVSVTGCLQRVRLRHARRLLADRTLSLVDVALGAGFADQSHMTRAMREAWDLTPGSIRRATLHPFKNLLRRSA